MILRSLLVVFCSTLLCCDALTPDKFLTTLIYKYLYGHEEQCGDPFVDPDWLPAVEECSIGCDETRFICLVHLQDQTQKCRALAPGCVRGLREHLGWSAGVIDETSTTTSTSTTTTTTTTPIPIDVDLNAIRETEQFQKDMMNMGAPHAPSFTTTMESFRVSNEIDDGFPNVNRKFREPPHIEQNGYGYNSMPAFVQDTQYSPDDSTHPPPYQPPQVQAESASGNPYETNFGSFVDDSFATEAPPYETSTPAPVVMQYSIPYMAPTTAPMYFENNVQLSQIGLGRSAVEIKIQPVVTTTTEPAFVPGPMEMDFEKQFMGTRIDLVPPPPPRDPVDMDPADAIALASSIQSFDPNGGGKTLAAQIAKASAVDKSRRCCEWAMQGLCDRSWKKVRQMCPKSCGSLICENVDGITSCNRVVDVDVEECFESMRVARYFGLRTVETQDEKDTVLQGIVQQKLSKKSRRKLKKKRRQQMT